MKSDRENEEEEEEEEEIPFSLTSPTLLANRYGQVKFIQGKYYVLAYKVNKNQNVHPIQNKPPGYLRDKRKDKWPPPRGDHSSFKFNYKPISLRMTNSWLGTRALASFSSSAKSYDLFPFLDVVSSLDRCHMPSLYLKLFRYTSILAPQQVKNFFIAGRSR